MKVKVISRNPDQHLRETKNDLHRAQRNYDPNLHPFQSDREYVRALNATKLNRVFAKPFIGNLDGHRDGVSCFAKHTKSLSTLSSGAYDGEIRIWNLAMRTCSRNFVAHDGMVRGITYTPDGERFISIGDDKAIKTWNSETPEFGVEEEPTNTILSRSIVTGISHHQNKDMFATCGEVCALWEHSRNEPIKTFKWGVDSLQSVAFNPVEASVVAACASDRSIILYDIRELKPMRKVVMTLRPNRLSWNPMEAYIFTVANEDFNLYTFDSRNLKTPLTMHVDHVSAVVDVDYSPTGKEFVSGGYDRTIRIYETDKVHSREVYHTKRMQHITCIGWSMDSKYIFTGSDEMNIRLWKANASEKLGVLKPRERAARNYNQTLMDKFATHPQIRRISHHRHVPKMIYNTQRKMRVMKEKQDRKAANRKAHSKPTKGPKSNQMSETRKSVLKEEE